MIRIGCSGWGYEHWRGILYPRSGSTTRWLETYAESFDTVEVNATFYRLPTHVAVERWADVTPDRFLFAVKASRYLTHVRRLRDLAGGMALLDERIQPLREASKLGPILWQLPPEFRRDDERLAAALAQLVPGKHAFEFRHETWFVDDVYALLREHDVALVVADRAPAPPSPALDTAPWSYVRFHNGRGRGGSYTRGELRHWADRVSTMPGDAYVYFNNDWEGFAIENARDLRSLVERASEKQLT